MAICNLVGGMALSTCTALDNVAESSIQSITLTIHKALIVIYKSASSKGGKGGENEPNAPPHPPERNPARLVHTVEHGYNELFYNEFMVITNLFLHPVVISVFHCTCTVPQV